MIAYGDSDLFRLLLRAHGSVVPKAVLYASPVMLVTLIWLLICDSSPNMRQNLGVDELAGSQVWSGSTLAVLIMLGFRTKEAYARFWESTTLLHQMQGEWFESVSCLFAFSASALPKKGNEVADFRHTLVRLMSLMHGFALEEIKDDGKVTYDVLDVMGLDNATLRLLVNMKRRHGTDRVAVIMHMVQMLMTYNMDIGVLNVAPPILSRVYQTLSRGLVNFINAQKISDTMFPFPFAQLTALFVLSQTFLLPIIITGFMESKVLAPLVAFVPLFGMHCLNFTAMELEMPFGNDPNDLPLEKLQNKMNISLLMLIRDTSDHIAHIDAKAKRDPDEMRGGLRIGEGEGEGSRGMVADSSSETMATVMDSASKQLNLQNHRSRLSGKFLYDWGSRRDPAHCDTLVQDHGGHQSWICGLYKLRVAKKYFEQPECIHGSTARGEHPRRELGDLDGATQQRDGAEVPGLAPEV